MSHQLWYPGNGYSWDWFSLGRAPMVYWIAAERDYLRADLFNRETE